eukprot:6657818-Prymnesium_polylepis.1
MAATSAVRLMMMTPMVAALTGSVVRPGASFALPVPRAAVSMQYYDEDGGGRGRGQRFAQYQREYGDDAPVDVAAVEQLIEDRTAARRDRDFEYADQLRDQLRQEFN